MIGVHFLDRVRGRLPLAMASGVALPVELYDGCRASPRTTTLHPSSTNRDKLHLSHRNNRRRRRRRSLFSPISIQLSSVIGKRFARQLLNALDAPAQAIGNSRGLASIDGSLACRSCCASDWNPAERRPKERNGVKELTADFAASVDVVCKKEEWGARDGHVVDVSHDAVLPEKSPENVRPAARQANDLVALIHAQSLGADVTRQLANADQTARLGP